MAALALAAAAVTSAKPRLMPLLAVAGPGGPLAVVVAVGDAGPSPPIRRSLTAGRWALYAAMLTALLLLARTERDRWIPLIFATLGILAVAGYVVLRMLDGDVESLFFGGRLRDPLGYVNGQAGLLPARVLALRRARRAGAQQGPCGGRGRRARCVLGVAARAEPDARRDPGHGRLGPRSCCCSCPAVRGGSSRWA